MSTSLYPLPTQRYAGRLLIELDPTADWTGVPEAQVYADGSAWLDYARLPKVGGGTENRILSLEVSDGADELTRTLRATLALSTAEGSLSSGAVNSRFNLLSGTFRPAIFGQRRILLQTPLGDPASTDPADWRARFWGYLDEHPASYGGDLSLFARGAESRLMQPYAGDATWIGTEGQLVTLPAAIQGVLDTAFGAGAWVVYTPDPDLEWAFPAFEFGPVDDVLQYVRDLARQRGAVLRWWHDDVTGRPQLTLFVLQQDKAAPDLTFAPGETEDIPSHGSDTTSYRNDFTLRYADADTGRVETIRRPATTAEVAAFGLRPAIITEGSTSQITTAAEANTMLDAVEAALRTPATVGSRKLPWTPGVEVNSLLRFTADARVSQSDVDLYVVSWTEREQASGNQVERSTTVELRGAPVGQLAEYLKSFQRGASAVVVDPNRYLVNDFRVIGENDDTITLGWTLGPGLSESWYATMEVEAPFSEDYWTQLSGMIQPLPDGVTQVTIPKPAEGRIRMLQVEGYSESGGQLVRGGRWRFAMQGTRAVIVWKVEASESGSTGTLTATVQEDSRGVVSEVRFWLLDKGTKTGPLTATSAGAGTWAYTFPLDPKHPLVVQAELVRSDGAPPEWAEPATFDFDKIATVDVPAIAPDGEGTAHVTLNCTDTDIATSAGGVESRVDGGAWTPQAVDPSTRIAAWDEVQTDAVQLLEVRGINLSGTPGPVKQAKIPPVSAPPPGASASILSALVQEFSPGTCSPAVPLVNRLTVSFANTGEGDTWSVRRFEDGTQVAAPASGIPVATTSYDDEIATDSSTGSTIVDVAYLITLSNGSTMWTQTLKQRRAVCP